jgi:AraC family transcriptional regulator, ethanolamine operon transcriptional activator
MLFKNLQASSALSLEQYTDFDHFHVSERYAHAESIPLSCRNFSVLRASLALPSGNLSLVRTFPRIIKGYDYSGRLLIVVPMDEITSTRLNGEAIGQSLVLIKGKANCTVCEPEGRLVSILSIRPDKLDRKWLEFGDGHLLLRLLPADLLRLQRLIRSMLEFAARDPGIVAAPDVLRTMQDTLFSAFDEVMCAGALHESANPVSLARYKTIVDQVDQLIGLNPGDAANERLAEEIGISVRTLQTASRSVCGQGAHNYSRLRRLWSVRRQLRTGASGLTVKASALAHGFWHISQFTNAYRASFGELPSATLTHARLEGGPLRIRG